MVGDFFNAMTLHFFYKHLLVIFLPLLLHLWQYTDPSQHSRILLFFMIQSNVYGGDLQSRLYFPPYLWWMSEISLPLNDFNISSPSLFPFIDLVITLPRQGFDFSSEEMSENNHFHRQLTLLAPFPFRIGCVLTPTDPVYYPLPNVSYPPAVSPDPQSYNHHRVVCPPLSCPISNCQASKN